MPYIKVNPEKLNSSAQSLKRIEGEINKNEEEFRYVSRQLDWKVSCEKDIDWILRKIDNELCEQSKVFGEMALFLENTSEMYKQLEYFNNKKNDRVPGVIVVEPIIVKVLAFQNKIIKICKDDVKCISKILDDKTLGFTGNILDYVNNLISFYNPNKEGAFGFAQLCKLAKSSAGVWKGLYDLLKDGMDDQVIKELFKLKYGDIATGVGVAGSFAGLIGSILQAYQTGDWDDFSGIGKSATDLGKTIYLIGKDSKVVKYSAYAYSSILKSALDFSGKTIEDIKKYSEDGKLTVGEIANTGVDASIKGLNSLVSELTFGAISLENTNISPEELSTKLLASAEGMGADAGALIRNNPARKKVYDEASNFKRTSMLIGAIGETAGNRIDGWVKGIVRKIK